MKKNIGLAEACMRTMLGFSLFGKGLNWRNNMVVILGSALIATGITRYCPCYQLLDRSSCDGPWEYAKTKAGQFKH